MSWISVVDPSAPQASAVRFCALRPTNSFSITAGTSNVAGFASTSVEGFFAGGSGAGGGGGGAGAGWPFGRIPRRSDLLALIEGVAGVEFVRGLSLTQTETSPPPADDALLVYSADHVVTTAGSTES